MKNKVKVVLFIIILLAAFLRIYKLDQVPVSLNWDEAAFGYNAYTIANWGKDEWGDSFPLVLIDNQDYFYFIERLDFALSSQKRQI